MDLFAGKVGIMHGEPTSALGGKRTLLLAAASVEIEVRYPFGSDVELGTKEARAAVTHHHRLLTPHCVKVIRAIGGKIITVDVTPAPSHDSHILALPITKQIREVYLSRLWPCGQDFRQIGLHPINFGVGWLP